MTIRVLYPSELPTRPSPIPVFPAVPSTIVPPGNNFFLAIASKIIPLAALSLIDDPGFKNSALP